MLGVSSKYLQVADFDSGSVHKICMVQFNPQSVWLQNLVELGLAMISDGGIDGLPSQDHDRDRQQTNDRNRDGERAKMGQSDLDGGSGCE